MFLIFLHGHPGAALGVDHIGSFLFPGCADLQVRGEDLPERLGAVFEDPLLHRRVLHRQRWFGPSPGDQQIELGPGLIEQSIF